MTHLSASMPSRIHVILQLPLLAEALPVARELLEAAVDLVDLRDEDALDALPCRLSHDLGIDARRLGLRSAAATRIRGGRLVMRGMAIDLDRGVAWSDGGAEFSGGTPVLAELFAMLDPAIDAPIGAILGSMGEEGSLRHAGPVVMTAAGPRWCVADSRCGDQEANWNRFLGIVPTLFSRLPGWALVPREGMDDRAWIDVDRPALEAFVDDECMRRARCGLRRLPPPPRRRGATTNGHAAAVDERRRRSAGWAT